MPGKKQAKQDLDNATAAYTAAMGDAGARLAMSNVFNSLLTGDDDQAALQYAALSTAARTLFGDAVTRLNVIMAQNQGGGGGNNNPNANIKNVTALDRTQ